MPVSGSAHSPDEYTVGSVGPSHVEIGAADAALTRASNWAGSASPPVTMTARRCSALRPSGSSATICKSDGVHCRQLTFPATMASATVRPRSEEHTSELQSLRHLVYRLLLEKKI